MNTTTTVNIKSKHRHVGIDAGKALLGIFIYELELHWQVSKGAAVITQLLTKLAGYKSAWGRSKVTK
ncbi:MAG: hypothetical protein KUG79_11235 [Pseudomonadales bacterium]|nr:hypothetical protein [Pseudomonadales bacterium]